MMRSLHMKRWLVLAMVPALGAVMPVWAAKKAPQPVQQQAAPAKEQFVDGIAAVVNKHVITLGQLQAEVLIAQAQLKQRKIDLPDPQTLRKQVLQRMITDELLRQEADRRGIKIDAAQVQQAADTIAQRNKISVDRLRQEIEKSGVTWNDYLKNLHHEVMVDLLRQRAVDTTIRITDSDVDAFLKNEAHQGDQSQPSLQAQQTSPQALGLAQILVAVPEGASAAKVHELRAKAESILAKLQHGADFASTAAASSDGPQALKGGELGVRPMQGWPDLFIQATQNLQVGQVSGIVQSGNGFHILKVLTRSSGRRRQAPWPSSPTVFRSLRAP